MILGRRRAAIEAAVPAVLDAVVAALRSGGTVRDGLTAAAAHGPLADDISRVLDHGDDTTLRDALDGLARSHPVRPLRFAVSAMLLALETGAAQAPALEAAADRVRHRVAAAREVRALSAPARVSGAVITGTPLVFAALVALIDSRVMTAALGSTVGRVCMVLGVAFQVVGARWMRALVASPLARAPSVDDELADFADLLALALAAGLTVGAALAAVAPRLDGSVGRAVRVALARVAGGRRLHDELAALPSTLGPAAQPLVDAMLAAQHDGAPAAATIERLAVDLHHAGRQRVAERVQRLPVLLLFPLVGCVLPAFVLLAVVPIALGSVLALQGG